MTARPGWSPSDYDRWLDRNLPDDEPTTPRELAQAISEQAGRLIKAIDTPGTDACDLHDLWVDIVSNAVEGREQARIQAMD